VEADERHLATPEERITLEERINKVAVQSGTKRITLCLRAPGTFPRTSSGKLRRVNLESIESPPDQSPAPESVLNSTDI
jgi:hypothetical protein